MYGLNRIPSDESMLGIDIVIFDIQDVGARFYTYISAMHNMMVKCAKLKIELIKRRTFRTLIRSRFSHHLFLGKI